MTVNTDDVLSTMGASELRRMLWAWREEIRERPPVGWSLTVDDALAAIREGRVGSHRARGDR